MNKYLNIQWYVDKCDMYNKNVSVYSVQARICTVLCESGMSSSVQVLMCKWMYKLKYEIMVHYMRMNALIWYMKMMMWWSMMISVYSVQKSVYTIRICTVLCESGMYKCTSVQVFKY